MHWFKKTLIVGVMLPLLAGRASAPWAASPSEIRSLAGVAAVRVLVEDFNLALQKTGLQKGHLQVIAEQTLQRNGFTVLASQEPGKVPIVYVRLSSVIPGGSEDAPVSFYLNVQIKQPAVLAYGEPAVTPAASTAPKDPPLFVTTWEQGTMAVVDRRELLFYVQNILTNVLGSLASDRQEAGGKNGALR